MTTTGIHVCSISALAVLRGHWTLFASFLDPDYNGLIVPAAITSPHHLIFRFNDVIGPLEGFVEPVKSDIERWIENVAPLPISVPNSLLVHCHLGLSRSVAAAAIAYATGNKRDLAALPSLIGEWSPRPWPNSLMLEMADDLLDLGGTLPEIGCEVRRRTARRYPEWVDRLAMTHRSSEVDEIRAPP